MLHALIMAGGGGTRFWPRSRQKKPKQFLNLVGERSLLQQAVDRFESTVPPERAWVIIAAQHRGEVAEHLPDLPKDRIIGEPCGRDTAACIGLGAALIALDDPDAIMMVTPADHVIEPVQEFRRAAQVAQLMVQEHPQALVTFGIPPNYPATGYDTFSGARKSVSGKELASFAWPLFAKNPVPISPNNGYFPANIFGTAASFSGKPVPFLKRCIPINPSLRKR